MVAIPEEVLAARLKPGALWWLLAVGAVGIAGYALALQDGRGVTDTVPGVPWLDQVHFVAGGIALLVGVFGFRRDLLVRHTAWHRKLGMTYCTAALFGGGSGLAMAVFSSGGMPAHTGFAALAVLWLAFTGLGLLAIKRGAVAQHRRWMVRSYALCYAAVTLRFELPAFMAMFGSFEPAYQLVSWTCWVVNLAFAEWWLARTNVAGRRKAA